MKSKRATAKPLAWRTNLRRPSILSALARSAARSVSDRIVANFSGTQAASSAVRQGAFLAYVSIAEKAARFILQDAVKHKCRNDTGAHPDLTGQLALSVNCTTSAPVRSAMGAAGRLEIV
jgi:hypothetical protein